MKNCETILSSQNTSLNLLQLKIDSFIPPKVLWTFAQIKKMAEHSSFVNSCCSARRGPPLIVSGSDDGTAKLWDMRHRGCIQTFPDKYQVRVATYGMVLLELGHILWWPNRTS